MHFIFISKNPNYYWALFLPRGTNCFKILSGSIEIYSEELCFFCLIIKV